MNTIEYNKDNFINYYSCGYESLIITYFDDERNENVLLKWFDIKNREKSKYPFTKEDLENKRKKLIEIYNSKALKDEIKVYDLITQDNNFIGYTMKKCDYKELDIYTKKKIKIKQLKLLRDKIEKLNNEGIYIGDYSTSNILSSKNGDDIKLCDLDNLKIKDLNFDIPSIFMRKFINKCSNIEYLDSYCFNLFTLSYLGGYNIHYALKSKVPNILRTRENVDIIDSMKNLDNSYKKRYLIDNLK